MNSLSHRSILVSLVMSTVLLAQETKQWVDAPRIAFDEMSRVDELVDLDDDGDLDGIGWWWNGGLTANAVLKCFRNDGAGAFTASAPIPISVFPGFDVVPTPVGVWDSVTADFDLDGDPDYALVIGYEMFVFLLDGPDVALVLHFTQSFITTAAPVSERSIQAGDYDGDG
ncbi:MAG: hypothetical protein KDB53_18270 [Planctomycetes bacterium]|nr:hypothetical protein [Planctomycetota bacterium]